MALQKQLVPVSFGQGINTKVDEKQQISGTLRRAINTVFDTLLLSKKRPGYDLINLKDVDNNLVENSRILSRFENELVLLTDSEFFSYSSTRNALLSRGNISNIAVETDTVVSSNDQHSSVDSTFVEGFRVIVFKNETKGEIRYSVIDDSEGSFIVSNELIVSSAELPRVAAIQGTVYVFYVPDSGQLKFKTFSILTPKNLSSEQTATASLSFDSRIYDIAAAQDKIFICYTSEPPTEEIKLFSISAGSALSSEISVTGETASVFINILIDSMFNIVVLYANSTNIKYFAYNLILTSQLLAPTLIETTDAAVHGTLAEISSDEYFVFYELGAEDGLDPKFSFIKSCQINLAGSVTTPVVLLREMSLVTKAVSIANEQYVVALYSSDIQSTYFLINSNGQVAAKFSASNAGAQREFGPLPALLKSSDTEYICSTTAKTRISSENGEAIAIVGVSSNKVKFDLSAPYTTAQLGDNLHVSGGILRMYDGEFCVEHGFNVFPENLTVEPIGPTLANTTVDVEKTVAGNMGVKEVQLITYSAVPVSTTYVYRGTPIGALITNVAYSANDASSEILSVNPTAEQMQFFLNYGGFLNNSTDNVQTRVYPRSVLVTGNTTIGFSVTFESPSGDVPQMSVARSWLRDAGGAQVNITISTTTPGSLGAQERQLITFASPPTAGTWTITIGAHTTAAIAFNASNANIKAILEALPNITTVEVTGSYLDGIQVRFITPTVPDSLMTISSSLTHEFYGGALDDGSYGYVAVYTWVDNFGQIHRSAPSPIVSVELGAGVSTQGVRVSIPTLKLTDKENVTIELYRTEKNGSIFYNTVPVSAPIINDKTVDFVSYTDGLSDKELISREPLYTTGGVLENIAAPGCSVIAASSERIAVAGIDQSPYTVRFSKIKSPLVPVEFTDIVERDIDPVGGRITALAVLDEKYIIFTERAVFYIAGQGPNNLGQQDDFTAPEQISTDIGCSDQRSVVVTPFGLMFKSSKGIYLLEKSLNLSYIGSPVEEFNDLTITSAKVLANTNQVIFTTNTPTALIYNYEAKLWGTYSNHSAISAETIGFNYYFLKSDQELFLQNRSKFSDGDSPITQNFETGWLTVGSIQGFQRVYKLFIVGEYKSAHKLKVSFAYDFKDAFTQSVLIDPLEFIDSTTYGSYSPYGLPSSVKYGGSGNLYQIRIDLTQQKCQSIKVKIEEFQDVAGAGSEFSAMTFEIGLKQGGSKLSSSNKFGTS